MAKIEDLVGETLLWISGCGIGDDEIRFKAESGKEWSMYHSQDCCESVKLEDIAGDISDLIGSPIISAEESTNSNERINGKPEDLDECTWTFYRIVTAKGLVVLRWLGESNGYYSESVDFELVGEVQ